MCWSVYTRTLERREKSAVEEKMTTESNRYDNGLNLFAGTAAAAVCRGVPRQKAFLCIGTTILFLFFISNFFGRHTHRTYFSVSCLIINIYIYIYTRDVQPFRYLQSFDVGW